MTLILSDKNNTQPIGLMEEQINRLRVAMRVAREEGTFKHKPDDRKHNAAALRQIWRMIQTAEIIADYSQRAFIALCAGVVPMQARAVNPKGELYDVFLSLDHQRGYTYRAQKDQVVPYEPNLTAERPTGPAAVEYELHRLQQYCEATIQKRANEAVVQIHSVKLMMQWHRDGKAVRIKRVRGINVDDTYNSFDQERPNYRRRHFAIPAAKLTLPYLQKRAQTFCDSARLVGESAVLQASYVNKPRQNAVLSTMSEATMIIAELHDHLDKLTRLILKDVSIYKGFAFSNSYIVQPEPLAMRYTDGITIYSGRHATSVYNHQQIKYDAVKRLVGIGAMTLDIPRFAFFAKQARDADKKMIDADKAKTIWKVGREFMQRNFDTDIRTTLRQYSKAAVTAPVTK